MFIAIFKGLNFWDILSSAFNLLEISALLHYYLAPNRKKDTKKRPALSTPTKCHPKPKRANQTKHRIVALVIFHSDVMDIKVLSFV